jgi:hypothetical protein
MSYRQVAIDSIEKAVAAGNSSFSVDNPLFKGRLREVVVSELIKPFLPPHIHVATGMIIDQYGKQSSQIDVILYDEQITAPIMLTSSEGLIPCHSVVATIEVKSWLSRKDISDAVQNARSVKLLGYDYDKMPLSGERGFEYLFQQKLFDLLPDNNEKLIMQNALFTVSSPACYVFAFGTDLAPSSGITNELLRLEEETESSNLGSEKVILPISGLCVADRGFAYCSTLGTNGMHPSFSFEKEVSPGVYSDQQKRIFGVRHNVVLKFISEVVSSCAVRSHQRWRIPLEVYFDLR